MVRRGLGGGQSADPHSNLRDLRLSGATFKDVEVPPFKILSPHCTCPFRCHFITASRRLQAEFFEAAAEIFEPPAEVTKTLPLPCVCTASAAKTPPLCLCVPLLWWLRHFLCIVFPLRWWLRYCLCLLFSLPSWLRHCLCLVVPMLWWLRYCLCRVCTMLFEANASPSPCGRSGHCRIAGRRCRERPTAVTFSAFRCVSAVLNAEKCFLSAFWSAGR